MAEELVKGELISKTNLKFSFEPNSKQKYFCIFALASKMCQIIKIMAPYHAD